MAQAGGAARGTQQPQFSVASSSRRDAGRAVGSTRGRPIGSNRTFAGTGGSFAAGRQNSLPRGNDAPAIGRRGSNSSQQSATSSGSRRDTSAGRTDYRRPAGVTPLELQPPPAERAPFLRPAAASRASGTQPAAREVAESPRAADESPELVVSPTSGRFRMRSRAQTRPFTDASDQMATIRRDMQARHREFWEMRNLVQSLPDEVDLSESSAGSTAEGAAERMTTSGDDQASHPLADELIDILRRAHLAYFLQDGGDQAKYKKRYVLHEPRKEGATPGWKIEDGKFWPQKAGINTVDPTFGWNIAMHCAALGKEKTLQRLIKFRYLRDAVGEDADDNIDKIEATAALNLGHRTSRRLDLREQASIRNDPELGEVQEGGYRVTGGYMNEQALRQFFDTAKIAGYPEDLLDEHRYGYWSMRTNKAGSIYKPVVFPRLSTVLTICHMVGERDMKATVQAAMKKSTEARKRGDRLAALTDFQNDMDYTDEASSKYKEAMAKENMFADAAVKMIESHLRFIPSSEMYLSKTTPMAYTNLQDPTEAEWIPTTLEDLYMLERDKVIDANTYIRVAPEEEWTVGTVFELQQGKNKQYSELKNDLVAALETDELLTKHYKKALQAFEAWEAIDPNLLSVGVEDLGPLFMTVLKHAVRDTARAGEIRLGELKIAERLLEKLGPIEAPSGIHEHRFDLIDFTLQDENGRTLKWLCRHLTRDEKGDPRQPFCDLPDGVDSSVPFYLYRSDSLTAPDQLETIIHTVWPLYLVGSHVTYYLDLFLDYSVTKQYWRAGGCKWRFPGQHDDDRQNYCGQGVSDWWEPKCIPGENNPQSGDHLMCAVDPDKSVYVVYSILFFFAGVIMTCCFDAITTMTTSADRKSKDKWSQLGWKCLLNVCYLRLPYEAWWKAYRAWSPTIEVSIGISQKTIEKTPRMPPMSWDQVKCSEGIFEALPQSMLQAFVVINDLYRGRSVTIVQALSLLTSYGNVAFVLGMMGPPDIRMEWRIVFMAFVGLNVVLRSAAFSFLTILDNDRYAAAVALDPNYDGWWGSIAGWYMLLSFIVTMVFTFGLQKKDLSLSSVILALIGFMCPVDISQFTVLKTAQPRSPQVPFAIVRYLEIAVICVMFAHMQESIPVIPVEVQTLDMSVSLGQSTLTRYMAPASNSTDQLIADGLAHEIMLPWETSYLSGTNVVPPDDYLNAEAEVEASLDDARKRWLFVPSLPSKGRWPEELVRVEQVFPFPIGATLTAVILVNIFTYLLSVVFPRKLLEPVPPQLKLLMKGSEIRTLTACCRRKEISDFKNFVKDAGGEVGDIALTLLTESLRSDEAEVEKAREHKRAKQEERRLQKQGKAAIDIVDRVLKDLANGKLDVRDRMKSDNLAKLYQYATMYGVDTTLWFHESEHEPRPEPEPEPEPEPAPAPAPETQEPQEPKPFGFSDAVMLLQQRRPKLDLETQHEGSIVPPIPVDAAAIIQQRRTSSHLDRAAALLNLRSLSAVRMAELASADANQTYRTAGTEPQELRAPTAPHELVQPRNALTLPSLPPSTQRLSAKGVLDLLAATPATSTEPGTTPFATAGNSAASASTTGLANPGAKPPPLPVAPVDTASKLAAIRARTAAIAAARSTAPQDGDGGANAPPMNKVGRDDRAAIGGSAGD